MLNMDSDSFGAIRYAVEDKVRSATKSKDDQILQMMHKASADGDRIAQLSTQLATAQHEFQNAIKSKDDQILQMVHTANADGDRISQLTTQLAIAQHETTRLKNSLEQIDEQHAAAIRNMQVM